MGTCALPHLGVIAARGEDAAHFLHNQLTQDFALLDMQHARLAAFCNAKGRMQASFVVYKRSAEEVLLICRKDLIAQTVKRLSMFVLRAKAKLSDASEEFQMLGLAGDAALAALNGASTAPWQRHAAETADVLTLYPALGQPRAFWIATKDEAVPTGPAMSADLWQVGEVMSGIAWVELATFEAFVPQMLNYESVDGVNFKKGCYPGQEVVARSQFRGILKRRTYIASSPVALQAGQEIFSSNDSSQPAGQVAQAVSHSQHGHWALVCLQTSSTEAGDLHPADSSGSVLTLHPLPYPLREDI
jgi:folate-binding protein YgfZ